MEVFSCLIENVFGNASFGQTLKVFNLNIKMIKSKIFDFLQKYLGEYLLGFTEDQLQVAPLKGHIDFNSANLKPQKVNEVLSG